MLPDPVRQVQTSIENLERSVQRQRQESQAAQKRLEEFRDVLEVVKNTLGNGAGALARKRGENANLNAQIEEKRVGLETARRKYQASRAKGSWPLLDAVKRYITPHLFIKERNHIPW